MDDRIRIMCVVSALLSALIGVGCQSPASAAGQGQLSLARQQYEKGQYTPAIQSLTDFLEREGNTAQAAQAYYLRGLCYMESSPSRDMAAERDLLMARQKAKESDLRAMAAVGLGHIYYEMRPGQLAEAVEHYEAALEGLGKEPPRDVVLCRLGSALQKLGRWAEGDVYFSQCIEAFPASEFSTYARDRFGARVWRLQYGAFSELERARRKVGELSQAGVSAGWQSVRQADGVLYVVQGGRYDTWEKAEAAQRQLPASIDEVVVVAAADRGSGR